MLGVREQKLKVGDKNEDKKAKIPNIKGQI